MDIKFKTVSEFKHLVLDGITGDAERQVSGYDFRRASEIAQTIHHYLCMLECEHYVPYMGVSFRAKNLKPLKCNILFQIIINWEIFTQVKAEILLEWDEDKKIIFFREFRKNKKIKDDPLDEPPFKERRVKNTEILAVQVAIEIIKMISATIKDISDDAKDGAMRLGFSYDKLNRILQYE